MQRALKARHTFQNGFNLLFVHVVAGKTQDLMFPLNFRFPAILKYFIIHFYTLRFSVVLRFLPHKIHHFRHTALFLIQQEHCRPFLSGLRKGNGNPLCFSRFQQFFHNRPIQLHAVGLQAAFP